MSKSLFSSGFPCEIAITTSSGKKITIEVLSPLGGGGYNNAYRVRQKDKSTEEFVLKTYISDNKSQNREAQILSTLRGQGSKLPVVRIIDPAISIGDQQGHLESLAPGKKLQEQLPSSRQALLLALGLAKLLKVCAEAEIAYRDIKPGDHIFWEPGNDNTVTNMTVIDWNISQYPATIDALYFDLVKFCNSLPEFFVGKPPQGAEYYHPLAWQYDANLQKCFPPRLRIVLANLCLNFIVPIIPNGEHLLDVTHLSLENILQAWDKVIETLSEAIGVLDGNEYPDLGFKDMPEYQEYLQKFLDALDEKEIEKWTSDLVYNWVNKNLIREPDKRIRPRDTEDMARLRLARLFNPGSFREAILLSLFVALYRTGLQNDASSRPICLKLLQGLLEQKAPDLFYLKGEFQTLVVCAREKADQIGVDAAKINASIWERLSTEFEIWIAYEKLRSASNEEQRTSILQGLDGTWGFHPAIAVYASRAGRTQGFTDKKKEIEAKLSQFNFEAARMLIGMLRDINADAAAEYAVLIGICERIQNGDFDSQNNPDLLNQLLQAVENSRLPLPSAYDLQYQALRERLPVLNRIRELQADINGADDLQQLQGFYVQMDELKKYTVEQYPGIIRLNDDWQEKLRRTTLDQLEELKLKQQKVSAMVDVLVRQNGAVPEIINTAIQPALGEIIKLHDGQENITATLDDLTKEVVAARDTILDEIKSTTEKSQHQLEAFDAKVNEIHAALNETNATIKNTNDAKNPVNELQNSFKQIQRLTIGFGTLTVATCTLLTFLLAITFNPSMFIVAPTATMIPTPTPTQTIVTVTSIPQVVNTTTPTIEPAKQTEAEKILLINALFFEQEDLNKLLWTYSNPSNFNDIKVSVIEQKDEISLVRIKLVVKVVDPNNVSADLYKIPPSRYLIRTLEHHVTGSDYSIIGFSSNEFQITVDGGMLDGKWLAGFFEGWVSNEYLQSEQQ